MIPGLGGSYGFLWKQDMMGSGLCFVLLVVLKCLGSQSKFESVKKDTVGSLLHCLTHFVIRTKRL